LFFSFFNITLGNQKDTIVVTLKLQVNKTDTVLEEETFIKGEIKTINVYLTGNSEHRLFIKDRFFKDKLISHHDYSDCYSLYLDHYVYDSTDKLLNRYYIITNYEGMDYYYYYQYLYSYDSHRNITGRFEVESVTKDTTEYIYYKYNENNELIEKHEYTSGYNFTIHYANGRKIKLINNKFKSGSSDEFWEYDSIGNLIEHQKDAHLKDIYYYNEYNKIRKIETHVTVDTIHRIEKIISYEYDKNGKLIKEQIAEGYSPIETYIYQYYYLLPPENDGYIYFYKAPSVYGENKTLNRRMIRIDDDYK
jgi:hypothetical protein